MIVKEISVTFKIHMIPPDNTAQVIPKITIPRVSLNSLEPIGPRAEVALTSGSRLSGEDALMNGFDSVGELDKPLPARITLCELEVVCFDLLVDRFSRSILFVDNPACCKGFFDFGNCSTERISKFGLVDFVIH